MATSATTSRRPRPNAAAGTWPAALAVAFLFAALIGCDRSATPPAPGETEGPDRQARSTVLWISVDGLRSDYIERGRTPYFDRLRREGAWTNELVPIFPSLTFPGHVTQATGVRPAEHGITANSFYDTRTGRLYRYPGDAALLEAEPVWLTAARQGVRVLVYDWPLSHAQQGPVTAAYFDPAFDRRLSDARRLERVLETWQRDEDEQPLRLLMSWVGEPDRAGHRHGPDSRQVIAAVEETDRLLARIHQQALTLYQRTHREGDSFYLLVTTDHGMAAVHTMVHPERLLDVERAEGIELVSSANIAHLFFTDQGDTRHGRIEAAVAAAEAHEFARAWPRDQLPQRWDYAHPARSGEVVVVLDSGYTFSRRIDRTTAPVDEVGGPLGMHGYDPHEEADMLGAGFIWRYPEPLGGEDLGRVDSLHLHATVARLLAIDPSPRAEPAAIELAPAPVESGR